MTVQHIVWMKEGFPEPLSGSYDGVVGGKTLNKEKRGSLDEKFSISLSNHLRRL